MKRAEIIQDLTIMLSEQDNELKENDRRAVEIFTKYIEPALEYANYLKAQKKCKCAQIIDP